MSSNLINFQKKHQYYNEIYDDLHLSNDKLDRVYTKPKPNFDFFFKDDTLNYSEYKDLDFNQKSLDKFKTIDTNKLNHNNMTMQKKISFYLTSNLVPGLNQDNLDLYKKESRFQSSELHSKALYKVDKWYFMKKDDLTAYYEKFFMDKAVDKLRKNNGTGKGPSDKK